MIVTGFLFVKLGDLGVVSNGGLGRIETSGSVLLLVLPRPLCYNTPMSNERVFLKVVSDYAINAGDEITSMFVVLSSTGDDQHWEPLYKRIGREGAIIAEAGAAGLEFIDLFVRPGVEAMLAKQARFLGPLIGLVPPARRKVLDGRRSFGTPRRPTLHLVCEYYFEMGEDGFKLWKSQGQLDDIDPGRGHKHKESAHQDIRWFLWRYSAANGDLEHIVDPRVVPADSPLERYLCDPVALEIFDAPAIRAAFGIQPAV